MERPQTSKSRGLCRYYKEPRGCFAGKHCKFTHGDEPLTPFDRSKICRYFTNGYCRRGEQCWFKHVSPSKPKEEEEEDLCCICLEKPTTYGLLAGCAHIFCISCIRQWRDPAGKSEDVVISGVTKKCPLCRADSSFITPCSVFSSSSDPRKTEMIEKYRASMARVPCRYFMQSKPSNRFCPFGTDCFYAHLNENGTPYIFSGNKDTYQRLYAERRGLDLDLTEHTVPADVLTSLSATINEMRESLPASWRRVGEAIASDDSEAAGAAARDALLLDSQTEEYTQAITTLERLTNQMLASLTSIQAGNNGRPVEGTEDLLNETLHITDMFRSLARHIDPGVREPELGEEELERVRNLHRDMVEVADREGRPSSDEEPSTPAATRTSETDDFDDDGLPVLAYVSGSEDEDEDDDDDDDTFESEDDDDEGDDLIWGGDFSTSIPWLTLHSPPATSEVPFPTMLPIYTSSTEEADISHEITPQGSFAGPSHTETITVPVDVSPLPEQVPDPLIPSTPEDCHTPNFDDPPPSYTGAASLPISSPRPTPASTTEDPAFITDGRGRVVWSSTSTNPRPSDPNNRPGSSSAPPTISASPRTRAKSRRSITTSVETSSPATAESAPPSDAGFMTDGRGRVIGTGSPTNLGCHSPAFGDECMASEGNAIQPEGSAGGETGEVQQAQSHSLPGMFYDSVLSQLD